MVAWKILCGGYSTLITTLSFDNVTSSLSTIGSSNAGLAPSWLVQHPTSKNVIYSTQEFSNPGQVWSFTLGSSGLLTKVASATTGRGGPAHMIVTSDGNQVIAMNYEGGVGTNIPLNSDKSRFGTPYAGITFSGSGPNPRQTSSHPHQVVENGNEFLVPDLGADKIWRLTKSSSGALQNSGYIQQPSGSGPRHIVIKNSILYTLHELSSTLTQQTLPPLGSSTQPPVTASISIIPTDSSNPSGMKAAELLLSPISSSYPTQYLYATNRGDQSDAITIVSIANNSLQIVKQFRTGLNEIRGAAFSPGEGKYLVVGGQGNGGVVVYERINGGADLREVARTWGVSQVNTFLWV